MPVRFIGVRPYSLDVEVIAYVTTSDYDEFVALQQELLLKMLQAVEHAGGGDGCAAAGELRIATDASGIATPKKAIQPVAANGVIVGPN